MDLMQIRRKLLLSVRGDNVQRFINNMLTSGTAMTKGYILATGDIAPQNATNKELTTDYLAVDSNQILHFVCRTPKSGAFWMAVSLYDANMAFISRSTISTGIPAYDDGTYRVWIGQLDLGNNAAKQIRVSFRSFGDCLLAVTYDDPNIDVLATFVSYADE